MEERIVGYVEKIVFRNSDNAYTVANLSVEGDDTVIVGYFTEIAEGNFIEAEGSYSEHRLYGPQFMVSSYRIKEPQTSEAIEKYLASGIIKGIGKALAARIIKKFGEETLGIIEREPERLSEIKGITIKKAREISVQFEEKREFREAMLFLGRYGVSGHLAMKIYKEYGQRLMTVIKENPYKLADDINGIGFKTADEIAMKAGFSPDSEIRQKAGILYNLTQAAGNGHTYLPYQELFQMTDRLLGVPKEVFAKEIDDLILEKKIVRKKIEEEDRVYHIKLYYMELKAARMLSDLNVKCRIEPEILERRLASIENSEKMTLEGLQRKAVYEAAESGLVIITGGPGTGKTTTINMIIRLFEEENMEILLAAPTGRAAKRMSETTGKEAQTVHRLLELNGDPEEGGTMRFERHRENPLEADAVIIDEVSMMDIYLMYSLLNALPAGTRLILVGDVNQLSSVGPGNVLKDMIRSERFNVVRLTKIFRQASESDIITNAHKINAGEAIRLDNKSKDFFMLRRQNAEEVVKTLLYLVKEKLPPYVEAETYDIQVLTPMRKGELGVENLNRVMQKEINPGTGEKYEIKSRDTVFRLRDKVMQIKNDYQLEWKIMTRFGTEKKRGTGVFNGDCGVIREVNSYAQTITVEFEEGKLVEYDTNLMDELELAYAVTIHKSQGSEYPAVVLPLFTGPKMLLNRNLLYTAVTRAKKCVVIVGNEDTVATMIANESEMRRYSGLADAIREIGEVDDVQY